MKAYLNRRPTRFDHQAEICEVYGYRPYSAAKDSLLARVGDQQWVGYRGVGGGVALLGGCRLRAERALPEVTTVRVVGGHCPEGRRVAAVRGP